MRSESLQTMLTEACESVRDQIGMGRVADYIPALARIDPTKFGASIITVNGEVASYGDAQEPFSIQSISKVFALTQALNRVGKDLWQRVSYEPSGNSFNSIVQLELEQGIPRNPFINAGALVVSDVLLRGKNSTSALAGILDFLQDATGDISIGIDREVARSELDTAHRNASLAHFMKSFNNLEHEVERVLDFYCHQCAIAMSCQQLARSLLFLAKEGQDPLSRLRFVSARRARRINAIMMLCGHYDASGEFAFRVGLPGKSGVGGGIVAIVPEVAVVAVWSPGLNASGNSLVGTAALEAISQRAGWNIL